MLVEVLIEVSLVACFELEEKDNGGIDGDIDGSCGGRVGLDNVDEADEKRDEVVEAVGVVDVVDADDVD